LVLKKMKITVIPKPILTKQEHYSCKYYFVSEIQQFRVFENPTIKEFYLFMTGTLPPLLSG